jgi:hypothetical protein
VIASKVPEEEHKALISNLDSRSRELKKEGTDGESWLLNCMFVCSTKIKMRVVRLDAQTGCGDVKEIVHAKQREHQCSISQKTVRPMILSFVIFCFLQALFILELSHRPAKSTTFRQMEQKEQQEQQDQKDQNGQKYQKEQRKQQPSEQQQQP